MMRRNLLDRFWLWRHRNHGTTTSWGVAADGSEGPCYWTCSCDPYRRYYPHINIKENTDA